jgi:hypothetical protein
MENTNAVVELSTIIKFSETEEKSLQKLLTTHKEVIESFREISNLSATFKVHTKGTSDTT